MTDLLTPSECAALAAIEAKMTPGEWRARDNWVLAGEWSVGRVNYKETDTVNGVTDAIGIVELRNAAPRMLATIAAHEATIAELSGIIEKVRTRLGTFWTTSPTADRAAELLIADIDALKQTIAELRKELEEQK